MYSGLTLSRFSGRLMGGHQKIDRIARRHLGEVLKTKKTFPSIRNILHFEGKNGPDGIKRKSPARDEPWHYLNPLGQGSHEFLKLLTNHYSKLVKELKAGNKESAAFEAAWLAHAVVDGLTPAHHYPYEARVIELRGGKAISSRTSIKEKWIFKGKTKKETVVNTFKAWGPKGLFTAHVLFELGFSAIIKPLRFPDARPSKKDLKEVKKLDVSEYFLRAAREIAVENLFDDYLKTGWNSKLTRQIRQQLAPKMVKTVTMIWYCASREADL